MLTGKWPVSHPEVESPTEYNGWSFPCLAVTHCLHITYTYLYTNTPQVCPCDIAHPPHTQTHTHSLYTTHPELQKAQPSSNTHPSSGTHPVHGSPPHTPDTPMQHHTHPPLQLQTPTSAHLLNTHSHPPTHSLIHTLTPTSLPSWRSEPSRAAPRRGKLQALGAACSGR